MKIVFIGGPYRGDGSRKAKLANIAKAKEYVKQFVAAGISFYSPHLNLSSVTVEFEKDTSNYAIAVHNEFFNRCDLLAVLPGWEASSGTLEEIELAKKRSLEIFYLENPDAIAEIKDFIT